MARIGKALVIPTVDELVILNRRLVHEQGGGFYCGLDNLANRGSLEHALSEMQAVIYGQELYPTLYEKAALLAWRIIAGHVFYDGNKRTGMAAGRVFLLLNGCSIPIRMEMVSVALRIATGQMTIQDLAKWFESQTEHT